MLCRDAQLSLAASDLLDSDLVSGMYHRMPCDCLRLDGLPSIPTGQSRYVAVEKQSYTAVVKRGAVLPRRLGMVCAEASSTEMSLRRRDMEVVQQSLMRQVVGGTSVCSLVLELDNYSAVLDQSRRE